MRQRRNAIDSSANMGCRLPSGSLLCALVAVVAAALAGCPQTAFGAFTRPFLRQTAGVPVGAEEPHVPPFESEVPFGGATGAAGGPLGVAINAEGDLWVGNGNPRASLHELDEFNAEGGFMKAVKLAANQVQPSSVAIDTGTGDIYIAGEDTSEQYRVEVLEEDGKAVTSAFPAFDAEIHVAVDNSSGLTKGEVYVARKGHATEHLQGAIEKFSATGESLPFAEIKSDKISLGEYTGIAVDEEGHIDALNINPNNPNFERVQTEEALEEFLPGGALRRVIGQTEAEGWGVGRPEAVGFDPKSHNILVAVSRPETNEGFVDEFNAASELISKITQVAAPSTLATTCGAPRSLSLNSATQVAATATGEVYVADETSFETCEHALDVYGPGRFLPSVTLDEASEREPTTATLSGSVNPEGQSLAECDFEYVTQTAYEENVAHHGGDGFAVLSSGGKVPCVPAAGAIVGHEFVAVHAGLTGLTAGTTYRYRLVAASSGESGGTTESQTLAFTAPGAPAIVSASATDVSAQDADLIGRIQARGADTSYYFQYVDQAQYRAGAENPYAAGAQVPAAPAGVGSGGPSGGALALVSQQVAGLAPDTAYDFRLVASNEVGVTDGPDESFATLQAPAAGLPDHRAYELVTPADKEGSGELFSSPVRYFNSDDGLSSTSGDEYLMFNTLAVFGPSPASEANSYVFRREAAGWRTLPVALPSPAVQSVTTQVFDPADFSQLGLQDLIGSASSPGGTARTLLVGPPGGPYATLHADKAVHEEPEDDEQTEVVGASSDAGHVILESLRHDLAPGAEHQDPGSHTLYEWSGGGECETGSAGCRLVNVNSEGRLLDRCGAVLGQGKIAGTRSNAVSSDGSQVIFTAPDPYARGGGSECWNGATLNAPQLYARAGGVTVKLSQPEAGVKEEGKEPVRYPAFYVGASEDGSKVFFVTRTELTQQAAQLKLHDQELYECEIIDAKAGPECKLSRVSGGQAGEKAGGVITVPAVSANGAVVYFTAASGELAPGAPAPGVAEADLYRLDAETGRTTYVATVDKSDYPRNEAVQWSAEFGESALAQEANWYTAPDGGGLVFASARQLTSYSTLAGPGAYCPFESKGGKSGLEGHCTEIYRYDAAEESLICVSCNPSGAPPVSNAQIGGRSFSPLPAGGSGRPSSDDGSYVFFDTADALVPQDTNGTLDVYEWHDGVVSLISSGQDIAPSYFLGASPDGSNVFFGTHAKLVPQATGSSGNVYDARIDGGFAASAAAELECEGEACQNPPPAPVDTTPASLTFSGSGNVGGGLGSQAGVGGQGSKKTAAQIRAAELARALKACKAKHGKRRRAMCEAAARKKYGKKAVKSTASKGHGAKR